MKLTDEAKANLQVSVDAVKELLVACKGIERRPGIAAIPRSKTCRLPSR